MRVSPLHRTVGGLGLATIVSYGGWYYSFGVLVRPIADDTGWTVAELGAAYAIGHLLVGGGSALGGRLLDRRGGRTTFGFGAVLGGGMLGAAAVAPTVLMFGICFAVAAAVVGATSSYHITMAAARRLRPDRPAKAIGPLTIYGALASPIFLPLTAVLVEAFGWRVALGALALTTASGLGIAAVLAPDGRAADASPEAAPVRLSTAIRRAWADPDARLLTLMFLGYGFGSGLILTYQVPIMVDFGLPLATASLVAGGRGFMQLTGRVGLDRIVTRFGVRRPLAVAPSSSPWRSPPSQVPAWARTHLLPASTPPASCPSGTWQRSWVPSTPRVRRRRQPGR